MAGLPNTRPVRGVKQQSHLNKPEKRGERRKISTEARHCAKYINVLGLCAYDPLRKSENARMLKRLYKDGINTQNTSANLSLDGQQKRL